MYGSIVTIGNFDGVHLGHQKVISTVVSHARTFLIEPMVVTFKGHPKFLKMSPEARYLLTTHDEKIFLIQQLGIKHIEVLEFNETLMQMGVEEFLHYLKKNFNMQHLVMGFNHHFGRNREGTPEKVSRLLNKFDFYLTVVPPVFLREQVISSTLIRDFLKEGRVEEAAKALGRLYTVSGVVSKGKGIAGDLGFKTVNITVHENKLLPGNGVYAVEVLYGEKILKGVAYIGKSPTLGLGEHRLEIHLINFNKHLYGENLTVNFVKFIRAEKKFASLEELTQQIRKDIQKANSILSLSG